MSVVVKIQDAERCAYSDISIGSAFVWKARVWVRIGDDMSSYARPLDTGALVDGSDEPLRPATLVQPCDVEIIATVRR